MNATEKEKIVFMPKVDVIELEDNFLIVADMPGIRKEALSEGLDISIEKNVLQIRGKAALNAFEDVQHQEFILGKYSKNFSLSEEVDQKNINAEYRNGVLKLILPKVKKIVESKINVVVKN